jgi:hypothetical protein
MKTGIAVLCLSAALIAGTTATEAQTTHRPTTIPTTILTTFTGPVSPTKFGAFGYLKTPPRCRGNRRVKVLFRYGSDTTWTPVDLGRSSGQGAWGGIGVQVAPSGSVTQIKVKVSRHRIGRSRRVCSADSVIHQLALGQHLALKAAGLSE